MLIKSPYTKSSSIKFNRCQRYVGLEANPIKHQSSTIVISYCCVNLIFLSLSGQMYKRKNNLYNFVIYKEKDQKQKITAIGFYQ